MPSGKRKPNHQASPKNKDALELHSNATAFVPSSVSDVIGSQTSTYLLLLLNNRCLLLLIGVSLIFRQIF
jgi:hypothetical protein